MWHHNFIRDHKSQLITTCRVWQRFCKQEISARVALIFLLGETQSPYIPFSSKFHIFLLLLISDNFVESFSLNLQISCSLLSQNLILSAAADSTGWNGFLITELEFLGSFCNVIGYLLSVI